MRATGATTFTLIQLFVGEGIIVGVLSWILAVLPSYLASQVLGDTVGNLLLRAPLDFAYSMEGAVSWLLIVIGLSALAGLLPALRAHAWSCARLWHTNDKEPGETTGWRGNMKYPVKGKRNVNSSL